MTTSELIEQLKAMPQDAEVVTYTPIGATSICGVYLYTHKSEYFGDTNMVYLDNGAFPMRKK